MIKNSNTRITLALDIVKKLTTGKYKGYHELNIIKHQIDLHDTVSIEESLVTEIFSNDPFVPLDNTNLCIKALNLIKEKYNLNKHVKITLYKEIPIEGGLAGGSANAATTIEMLNEMWQLNMTLEDKIEIGRQIGMDVPFYFCAGTAIDTEISNPKKINTNLKFDFIIVIPDFGVSTTQAYKDIDYNAINLESKKTKNMIDGLNSNNALEVIKSMHNDFEKSVFSKLPELKKIKDHLITLGCLNAVMSGSGSSIIGVLKDHKHGKEMQSKIAYKTILAKSL